MQQSKRNTIKTLLTMGAATVSLPLSRRAFAQSPITLYVGFPAGGIPDLVARALAQRLPELLGRTIVVNNRTGAGGQLAIQAITNARPDGSSYALTTPAPLTILPHLHDNFPYDVNQDLKPVSAVCSYFTTLAVNPKIPVDTLPEFFEWCRQNPDQATCGVPGMGTTLHFMTEQLAAKAQAPMQVVPYKGGPALSQAVVAGEIAASLNLSSNFAPLYHDKRVKLLAITSETRLPALPEVPTFREYGYGDIGAKDWMGVMAHTDTPSAEVSKLHDAIQTLLADKSFQEDIAVVQCLALPMTSTGFGALITETSNTWEAHIKSTGFKLNQ